MQSIVVARAVRTASAPAWLRSTALLPAAALLCGWWPFGLGAAQGAGTAAQATVATRPAAPPGRSDTPRPAGALVRTAFPSGQLQRLAWQTPEGESAYAEYTSRGELRSLHCGDRPMLGPTVDDARLCGFSGATSHLAFMAENGMVRARGTYQAGRRIRYETFQDNGMPGQQEEIVGSTRVERTFGPEGARRREVRWTLTPGGQTIREREQEFAASGVLTRERRWSQGALDGETTYYLNGRPRSQAQSTLAGGVRMLETREFYDNGVLSAEGRYIDTGRYAPTPTGLHRQYDLLGRVKTESLFDARGRVLRERAWKPSGELARDDEVLEDGSRRTLGSTASR